MRGVYRIAFRRSGPKGVGRKAEGIRRDRRFAPYFGHPVQSMMKLCFRDRRFPTEPRVHHVFILADRSEKHGTEGPPRKQGFTTYSLCRILPKSIEKLRFSMGTLNANDAGVAGQDSISIPIWISTDAGQDRRFTPEARLHHVFILAGPNEKHGTESSSRERGICSLTVAFEGLADHVLMMELDEHVAAVWKTILMGQAEWLAQEILRSIVSGSEATGRRQERDMVLEEQQKNIGNPKNPGVNFSS